MELTTKRVLAEGGEEMVQEATHAETGRWLEAKKEGVPWVCSGQMLTQGAGP